MSARIFGPNRSCSPCRPIEKGRYFSLQFIDQYTFNFAYVGSRATGNEGGSFLLAGPRWKGAKPDGITSVIQSETDFVFVLFRTQLFDPSDIDKVKAIQAGYKVQSLSAFLGQSVPAAVPVNFAKPVSAEEEKTSLSFFNLLNFVLQFCPTHPSEAELMARFAKIGIGAGRTFDSQALPPDVRTAIEGGMADAWKAFKDFKETQLDTGKRTSGDGFGTRAHLNGSYIDRMASAVLGIYGNSKEEAMYPVYFVDADGRPTNAAADRYVLRFPPQPTAAGQRVLVADVV